MATTPRCDSVKTLEFPLTKRQAFDAVARSDLAKIRNEWGPQLPALPPQFRRPLCFGHAHFDTTTLAYLLRDISHIYPGQ